MTHKDALSGQSRATMRKVRLVALWLYENELDEIYGDFKPKRLPKFDSLKPGKRWKLLYDAFQMYSNYKFVSLVLDRAGVSECAWLRRIIQSCGFAGSSSCRERLRTEWGRVK
jgi:hypothetical protein